MSAWSGRVFVGMGRVLYVGGAADTTLHAHHAIQICVSLSGQFRLRSGPPAPWMRYHGAIIRSDQPHELDGSGCEVVIFYLEPESAESRRLTLGGPDAPIQAIPPVAVRAIRAATAATHPDEVDPEAARCLCRNILAELGARLEGREALHERLGEVLLAIRADPTRRWRVAQMVELAGLSSRRFRGLFALQVGMSCRAYLLWSRLDAALGELARGASLTQAAHAAGFADAAHLTRTFRRMVGIVPSSIARSVTLMDGLR